MKWLRPLYVGETIAERAPELVKQVDAASKGKFDRCILFVLSTADTCNLDLLPVKASRLSYYQKKELCCVGIARNKKEALELLPRILQDCTAVYGTPELKAYFLSLPADRFTERGEVSLS